MQRKWIIRQASIWAATLALLPFLLSADGHLHRLQAQSFLAGIEDVPVMQGLSVVDGAGIEFDSPSGRIAEALRDRKSYAEGGSRNLSSNLAAARMARGRRRNVRTRGRNLATRIRERGWRTHGSVPPVAGRDKRRLGRNYPGNLCGTQGPDLTCARQRRYNPPLPNSESHNRVPS